MVKILLKKQLAEIFRSYFYDAKKNKARSKAAVAAYMVLFVFLMVGILGGLFTFLSVELCRPLSAAGLDWLYFAIMGMLAVFLGAFGSVFNTYSGLYLAKDNDLLLSMPIPVSSIMVSRLLGVYLMGLMYSGVVAIPAAAVYLIAASHTVSAVIGCILLIALISVFVLTLSSALGWVVAKISLKLKNKSFITVIVSLLFFGAYYFFYFKAQYIISDLIKNAAIYGAKVKGAAYPLYLFGKAGTGDFTAMLAVTAAVMLLFALMWALISRSFLKLATATGKAAKKKYREAAAKRKSISSALLRKEFSRFTSSPNYMLNCGMGILLCIILGIFILIKGNTIYETISAFGIKNGDIMIFAVATLCMLASMNDTAAPSVSLEGKSLWLLQSLPVNPWQILRAKLLTQILLTLPPLLFCCICAAIVLKLNVLFTALIIVYPIIFAVFSAGFGLTIGILKPNLTWTNEITPIKQSLSVVLVLFSGWIYAGIVIICYLALHRIIDSLVLVLIFAVLTALATAIMLCWLKKCGTKRFKAL